MQILDKNHFFFESTRDVSNICQSFFEEHKMNYFQFCRVYKDDSMIALINSIEWMNFWTSSQLPVLSSIKSEIMSEHHYSFLWDKNLPEEPVQIAKERFDIHNGLCFVFRHVDYYELIAFGSPKNKESAIDYYFNHYNILKKFIIKFRIIAKQLIDKGEENKIILPKNMHDQNKKILLKQKNETHLTSKELQCVQLLSFGYPIKEIARTLDLSPRTVETYFERIRGRLKISSNRDLSLLVR